MIKIDHLSYAYPNKNQVALCAVSWQIETGDFVLVAGPSGSGKSTLLRCLNGLVPHFSGGTVHGQVTVNGIDALAAGPHELSRHVGFVLQNPEAQAVLDRVEPEIAFGLENAALPPQEMRVRVEEVLDLLDLTPLRERPLTTLSGGERQRVAIAAALALRPQILVLDEPTSQLDPQSAEDVLRALARLNEDLGLTIILAEHRLERVLRYVDRVTFMENGRIQTDAPVQQAIQQMPQLPPLVRLGRQLGWEPLPLTVKAGRRFARKVGQVCKSASLQVSPSPTPSLLKVDNLRFAYNGRPTLNGINLAVHAGETVAVMGRNGAGKSTLLKCVMGLLAGEGEVAVNGRSTHNRHVADISREIAYLPQNPDDLLFAETVADELAITLRNHGMVSGIPIPDTRIENGSGIPIPEPPHNGIGALLGELGLAEMAGAYPRDLSVGQRQRTALGAVAITRPKLLLLDEPTRGLDYAAKQALVNIWKQWLADGMGLLLVTHDVELVAQIADRVLIMSQGEIIAKGQTADVLSASPLFAPQISRLFPNSGWLTVEDAMEGMQGSRGAATEGRLEQG